jgi:predicted acetyltransferase
MVDDYQAAGETRYQLILALNQEAFALLVGRWTDRSQGIGVPPGQVPNTSYWLVREGSTIVGTARLRHQLTPDLEQVGGHIGYDIAPSQWRKGYGTRLLALVLEQARARGLRRVLITCDTDNIGSARIIEKNGGVRENIIATESGVRVSRYWIDLAGIEAVQA